MNAIALDVEGMSIERHGPEIIFRLCAERLRLGAGEAAALIGASGCGKSTLLDILSLVLWPDRLARLCVRLHDGTLVDATDIARGRKQAEAARLRAKAFGYILQTGGLLPFLTVRQNLHVSDPAGTAQRAALVGRIGPLAEQLGISAQLDKLPAKLSVGERQRAAILRAVVKQPSVILADEPTANLDPIASRDALALLLQAARDSGSAVLIVSHDHELVREAGLPVWTLELQVAVHTVEAHLRPPGPAGAALSASMRMGTWTA